MSNVHDAVALVSARHHYNTRADALERQAYESSNPHEREDLKEKAKLARKAAIAELVNQDPRK